MTRSATRVGITWSGRDALRGVICALPAVPVLLAVDVSLGVCLALGTLPVAALGVPPRRRDRPRLLVVGAAFALAYAAGCAVGGWPVVAVASLSAAAFASVLMAARRPAALVVGALLVPGFALGMNEPWPDGLALAAVFLAGSVWATIVACLWPESRAASPGPPPAGRAGASDERAVRRYALCFAAAAGTGLVAGHLLDVEHVGWAAAAALFIMRPDPGLLASRALGRVLATFAGVLVAALISRWGVAEIGLAVISVAAVASILAVRQSPWYVTPAGTALLVVLMSGVSSTEQFSITLHDRLIETAVGAALALAFGVVVPSLAASARRRSPPRSSPGPDRS